MSIYDVPTEKFVAALRELFRRSTADGFPVAQMDVEVIEATADRLEGFARLTESQASQIDTQALRFKSIEEAFRGEVARITRERDLLQQWKDSAMAVEREWDPVALAQMLGGRLGESQRVVIMRQVPKLLDRIRQLKLELEVHSFALSPAMVQARNDQLNAEVNRLLARIKRLEEAGNEITWEFCPASVSMMTERQSAALKRWNRAKEAQPTRVETRTKIVASVEEVDGIMGPDIAVIALSSGHVLEVGVEGVSAWPSLEAQQGGDNADCIGGITFPRKETQP